MTSGADCRNTIEAAFDEAEQMIIAGNATELQGLFNLCNPIVTNSTTDVSSFFQNFYDLLVEYVQQQQ